jgi:dephospho-CoA kinase
MCALRIGLTGGIGSGKSTVAGMLVEHGAVLIDADAIARELTRAGGTAIAAIVAAFGSGLIGVDGALDREAMRALAFRDPDAKRRLEAILHPLIGAEARERAQQAERSRSALVVFDVPLLAESSHWRERVDRVLVIDCPAETQVQRVAARPGWSPEAARRVIAQQSSRERRRAIADAVIFNHGLELAALATEVRALLALWIAPRGVPAV